MEKKRHTHVHWHTCRSHVGGAVRKGSHARCFLVEELNLLPRGPHMYAACVHMLFLSCWRMLGHNARVPITLAGNDFDCSSVDAQFDGRSLVIDNAEARVGRHGSMRAQGRLPLHPNHDLMDGSSNNSRSREGSTKVGHASKADAAPAEGSDSVVVDLANLDLRVSNLYTGAEKRA